MAIKFNCPHCRRALNVKDHLAGKKAACPACKKVLTIPQPAPAPVAEDVENLAAAAFAESRAAADARAAETIDFTCPLCDEPVSFNVSEGGKRAQCPKCRNIIKVPLPEKKDPTDWRNQGDNLPSGARRDTAPAPEGAWNPANAKLVSREALEEAGALRPDKRRALTTSQKVNRGALAGAVAFAVLVGSLAAYKSWARGRQDDLVARAAQAAEDAQDKEAGAALHRAVGEYVLRGNARTAGDDAKKEFDKARAQLAGAAPGPARDLLLADLALSEADLGGVAAEVDGGRRLKWDEVQKQLGHTLNPRHLNSSSWGRFHALRLTSRKLIELGQGTTAVGLAAQLAAPGNPAAEESLSYEGSEALGVVGLEFLRAGQKDQAERLLTQAQARPQTAPSVVALAVALGKPEPKAAASAEELDLSMIGRAEGQARLGNAAPARAAIRPEATTEVRLRALLGIVAATVDAGAVDQASLDAAAQLAVEAANARNASPWLVYRLVVLAARAGQPDTAAKVADTISDPVLRGRAQYEVLRARLKGLREKKEPADEKLLAGIDKQSVALGLAYEAVARHNAALDGGAAKAVEAWDEAVRPFGLVGAALGLQDAKK